MVIQQLLSVSAASLFGFPGKEHNLLDVHKLWIYILLVYWMYKTILLDIYWMYIHKLKKIPDGSSQVPSQEVRLGYDN